MPCSKQDSGKYVDFTKDQIIEHLDQVKKLIFEGKYIISRREENDKFAYEYRIDTDKGKEIFLNLQITDFCYAAANYKLGYTHERLYVFCKVYELDHWGKSEVVEIYIKTNLTKTRSGDDYMIVISFHKLNSPIKYLFG